MLVGTAGRREEEEGVFTAEELNQVFVLAKVESNEEFGVGCFFFPPSFSQGITHGFSMKFLGMVIHFDHPFLFY